MFTGIVEELGSVAGIDVQDRSARLHIACRDVLVGARVGDSVSVDGTCLTITTLPGDGFTADLMAETMRATSLGDLAPGRPVNLERAMRADSRFGGHLVQGHVDGVGIVSDLETLPGTVFMTIEAPDDLARYLVAKGSISVAGVSLTVVDREQDGTFRIGLIPHTLDVTTLGRLGVGDRVNLEVDVVAKYVEQLLAGGAPSPYVADQGDA